MAAAGVAEGTKSSCALEFRCMRLQPAGREIHVANRGRVSCFRRLAKFDGSDQYASAGELSIDAGII
jgi:hypothetical protein